MQQPNRKMKYVIVANALGNILIDDDADKVGP